MSSKECLVCNKSNAQFCQRCKSSLYCSPACQKADWATHKLLCEAFSKFDISARPSKEHVRGILFPVDSKKPELLWLHCEWRDSGDGYRYQYPGAGPHLGTDTLTKHAPIQYNPILKRALMNTIYIAHRDTFLIDGSQPNRSISTITSTKLGQYHDWRGPIVAYGKKGLGIDPIACKDLDMKDFRHITDYFLSYNSNPLPTTAPSFTPKAEPMIIKGVRINCLGDQKILNKPAFEAIDVPLTDPIFSNHDTSDIAKIIELPIFTRCYPPNPKWANDNNWKKFDGQCPYNNQAATFLHLCCDPNAKSNLTSGQLGWGWAPTQWQNDVGSTLVVRQDKRPLSVLHMEALSRYCQYEARDFLAHSMGEYTPEIPMSRERALGMICRPGFVISWYKFLNRVRDEWRKIGEGENVFPYES